MVDYSGDENNKDNKNGKIAIRITVEGRVQKVGFRQWVKQTAIKHNISGWVRNKADLTVEAFFFGEEKDVREIINMCYQGPAFAHVKRIKEYPQKDVENLPNEFIILSGS